MNNHVNIDVFEEFNKSSSQKKFSFLRTLFENAIYIREDAWYHYQDAKTIEIKDENLIIQFASLLKMLDENDGNLVNENSRKN
jgi:hypothetical protein